MKEKDIIAKPKSPCLKDCENRTAFCKCNCVAYKEYEKEYKKYIDKKAKRAIAVSDYNSYKEKLVHKARKRSRKKV